MEFPITIPPRGIKYWGFHQGVTSTMIDVTISDTKKKLINMDKKVGKKNDICFSSTLL